MHGTESSVRVLTICLSPSHPTFFGIPEKSKKIVEVIESTPINGLNKAKPLSLRKGSPTGDATASNGAEFAGPAAIRRGFVAVNNCLLGPNSCCLIGLSSSARSPFCFPGLATAALTFQGRDDALNRRPDLSPAVIFTQPNIHYGIIGGFPTNEREDVLISKTLFSIKDGPTLRLSSLLLYPTNTSLGKEAGCRYLSPSELENLTCV